MITYYTIFCCNNLVIWDLFRDMTLSPISYTNTAYIIGKYEYSSPINQRNGWSVKYVSTRQRKNQWNQEKRRKNCIQVWCGKRRKKYWKLTKNTPSFDGVFFNLSWPFLIIFYPCSHKSNFWVNSEIRVASRTP